ncbi:InlB B-repeat-containing protein [Clostridium pasteurianum]|uniref:InlB B-repeat-containing protein n=1 Tax=Clostridium pasteurianum TaxID=1501 RepID=UPI00117CF257|nr:tetratricopeptide repeat protein [Clostridium pasteurianum]
MRKIKRKKAIMIAIIVLFFLSLGGVISVKAYNSYNVKQNLDLGNKYLSDGKYEQAILAFEKVISIEPSNVEARVGLSKAYVALKRFKSAEKVLSEGIRIMEKKPDSRLYSALADVYLKQDKVQDAIKILDEGYSATHDKGIKEQLNDISSRITIQSESIDVQVGKSLSLKLYATDSDGKLLELTGNWMLQNSSLGALTSSKGFNVGFNANSVGSEVIIVKIGSITKRITINVKQHILQSIDIVADKENPVVGESINLKAVGKDQSGKEMDINPTWSVNNDTGSLANPQGTTNTLKLNKNGKVGVNVSQDKVKGSKTITVNKKKYSVATSVSGRGSITASHNADKYDEGTNVKYTAVPQNGWVFKGWQGSVSGSANPITVNINANKTVKAVFVQKQFTLNTNVRGQGTVRRDVNRSSYTNSSVVTLTTSAPSGWKFDHWTGDAAGNSRSIKVLMNSNKNVTAVFVQVPQAPVKSQPILSAPKPEQKPEIKPEPKPAPIPKPESVQEPAPKPEPKPEPLSKPTPAPTYELKTDSSGQGTVTRDVSGDKYQSDSIVTLTATAEEGWYFDHWEGDVTGTTNFHCHIIELSLSSSSDHKTSDPSTTLSLMFKSCSLLPV